MAKFYASKCLPIVALPVDSHLAWEGAGGEAFAAEGVAKKILAVEGVGDALPVVGEAQKLHPLEELVWVGLEVVETHYWAVQHSCLQAVEEGGQSTLVEGEEVTLLVVVAHFLVEEGASLVAVL